jgi:formiminotetrahydrofolate cyclodeaminase
MGLPEERIGEWLGVLGSRTPTPGGGAAAAMLAAVSASLLQMVSLYTTGQRWSDREERMLEIAAEAADLRAAALELAHADELAFASVGAAYGLPKGSDEERARHQAAVQEALLGAVQPPLRVGELSVRLVALATELAGAGNPNVISDVAVASSSARAALESAVVNIEINRGSLRDPGVVARLGTDVERLTEAARAAESVTDKVLGSIRS